MAANALLKNIVLIEEWIAATKETKEPVLWIKLFPTIKQSNQQEKNIFRNNYFLSQPFFELLFH